MTNTDPVHSPLLADTAPSKEAFRQELNELERAPFTTMWPAFRVTAIAVAVCGIVGWISEWLLGPWLQQNGEPVGLPPLASIAFMMATGLLIGSLMGASTLFVARLISSGHMTVEVSGPMHVPAPVWWVRSLLFATGCAATLLGIGCVILLGTWVRDGYQAAVQLYASEISRFVDMVFFVSFGTGLLVAFGRGLRRVSEHLRGSLLASDRLWFVKCSVVAVLYALIAFIVLMGIALLADPFFAATFLGSTRTFGTVTAVGLLAAWLGFLMGRENWQDREEHRRSMQKGRPVDYHGDFRTWDIARESSLSGKTPEGFPLYLWRESADDRLGLARSRYCCVVRDGDELMFQFYDPVGARGATSSLAVALLAGGAAAAWTLVDYFVLGHTVTAGTAPHTTPPFLIILNAAWRGAIFAAIAGGTWYLVSTLLRWVVNRFEADGRLHTQPWRTLQGFRTLNAGDAGAMTNGVAAKGGYGIAAVFSDSPEIVLTGNAWDYKSSAGRHDAMTRLFVDTRHDALFAFAAQLKAERRGVNGSAQMPNGDIPAAL